MSINIKFIGSLAKTIVCATVSTLALAAYAQNWPAKPVTIISPYGAGGSNDTSIRIIAEQLEAKYGQRMLVENKPGAGTRIANASLARSEPDGYTLLWAAAPFAINAAAGIETRYDIKKDFVPVGPRVNAPIFLVVNANSPVKSVADFVKMAQQKSDGVTFASPGIGSGPHLTGELFGQKGKFKVISVHYKGDAAAYTDLLGSRVDAALTAITTALPHVKAGKLRVIAVASEERTPVFPDAPTFAEAGVRDVVGYGWFGFVAPAGTPQAVVTKLNQDVNEVLKNSEVTKKLIGLGLQPVPSTSTQFGSFIQSEVNKWGELIRATGIKLE